MAQHKLTDIFGIKAALERLTSYNKVLANGETVLTPFNFSGKTRWNIGKNLRICSDAVENWQKSVVEPLKTELGVTSETKEKDPKLVELNVRASKQAEEIVEDYKFVKIPFAELTDDKNPVSGDVLSVLDKFELVEGAELL